MIGKYIILLYKIFFIGLLLQFFAFNIATFSLGLDAEWMKFVRLWKEILLFVLILISVFLILTKIGWKGVFPTREITGLKFLFATSVLIAFILHYALHQLPLNTFVLAFKYDFLPFLIFFVGYHSSQFIGPEQRQKLVQRYGKVLKIVLLLALGRYLMTFIKPGVLKIFGYNNFIYEGTAGGQAPAVYYTHINQGLPRSSFLFERPTTFGFYLTAFFPLFYYLFLHGRKLTQTRARRAIYGLNILLTFSRAARGAWIIELVLIGAIHAGTSWDRIKGYLIKGLLPLLLLIGSISYIGYQQIFAREYSNTGHIAMLQQGRKMFVDTPWIGHGGASAGPGSHRHPDRPGFNPENQFLQILIEFGLLGFLPWFGFVLYLCFVGLSSYQKSKNSNLNSAVTNSTLDRTPRCISSDMLLALSAGMIGLCASGMILHSLADRMVVYPFMLMFGIVLYALRESQGKIGTRNTNSTE